MRFSQGRKGILALILTASMLMMSFTGCSKVSTAVETVYEQTEEFGDGGADETSVEETENGTDPLDTEEPVAMTAEPTEAPTEEPTSEPTEEPTENPTEEPTAEPTEAPSDTPRALISTAGLAVITSTPSDGVQSYVSSTPKPSDDTFKKVNNLRGYTNRPYVNFRSQPFLDSALIRILTQGSEVTVISETSEWYCVKYGAQQGYIAKRYVTLGEAATEAPAATATPKPNTTPKPTTEPFTDMNKAGYTNKTYVNFRSAPSTSAEIIRILNYGTDVKITGQTSEWYRVKCGGTLGYIAKPYVTLGSLATPTPKPTSTPDPDPFKSTDNMAAYVNIANVNLRAEPSTDASILAVLKYGNEVRVTAGNSKWYRVQYSGKTGYIAKKYLTFGHYTTPKPTSTPTPKPTNAPSPTATPKPTSQFTDYEIHLVAALIHLEGNGSTYVGYRALASIVYNRVMNKSGKFPNDVAGVIFQHNQFGNRSRALLENTNPNSAAKAAAEYVFRTHGSTLPAKVLFYRAAYMGKDWYDFTQYYATIEGNNYYYGIKYY